MIPLASSISWTPFRVAVVVFGVALAGLSARSALTAVTARTAPQFALSVSPSNPAALTGFGEQRFLAALASGKNSALIALAGPARAALAAQALSPTALRQLGYAQLLSGDVKGGNRLLALARKATRRDFGVQLWSIEEAVNRNDLDGAIRGYVSTMEVLDESWGILFPRLAAAIENPEISAKLAPYIRRGGRWVVPFLNLSLAKNGSELPILNLVKQVGRLPAEAQTDGFDQSLLRVLIARGRILEARQFYLSQPYADRDLLENVAIPSQELVDQQGPVVWQFRDALSFGGMLDSDRSVTIFADDSVRGVAAAKLLFLGPGQYRLMQKYADVEMPAGGFVQWKLNCLLQANATREAWVSAPLRPRAGATLGEVVNIPAGCPAQTLELSVAGGIDRNRTSVTITALKLDRIEMSKNLLGTR
jgi:hypothetical protein